MSEMVRLDLRKGLEQSDSGLVPEAQNPPCPDVPALSEIPSCSSPLLAVDAEGHILEASEAALILLEQEREPLMKLLVQDVILHLDEPTLRYIFQVAPIGRTIVIDAFVVPFKGRAMPCKITVIYVRQGDESPRMIFLHLEKAGRAPKSDSAAPAAEIPVSRAIRLEMAGLVAGQIAHDFNNLLTPLLAYPELIRQEVKENTTVSEYLSIIEKTSNEMQSLTQKLLTLARHGRVGNEVFCVNEVIAGVIRALQPTLPVGINLECDLADNLLNVAGSRSQLFSVLENLSQNAVDAMGESGVLTIRTENVYLDAPIGAYDDVTVGEYVKISLLDTGTGIPEDVRQKIFDPFFTTKRASKKRGSGLGLSIVHRIVKDHRGYIDFDSTLGQGSVFFLYFPISRDVPQEVMATSLLKGTERILVVDDDPPQVQVLTSLLEALGYKGRGAASGEEALSLIKEQSFDLVILDMIMDKGMDGLTTFLEIKKRNPGQRVILMSGHSSASRSIVKAQRFGTGTYLRKPLTLERVAKAVRAELEQQASGSVRTLAPRILIADDEQMIRKLFGMIITSEFREALIDQAVDGKEAVEAFSQGCHDLIIMDLQMPGQDGRESFFEILKVCENNRWAPPPIIFCTGFTPSESLAEIIKDSSIHCLLRKPVKAESLLEAVRMRLQK